MNLAVFLDRDGVINLPKVNNGRPYPPSSMTEFELLPGVVQAVRALSDAGYKLIVVTNQPDVATGVQRRETVEDIWSVAASGTDLTTEHRRRLRLAATNATLQSARTVDLMYHAGGGTAVYATSPLQRLFRDVHVATQHVLIAPRTYELIGRMALGLDTDTTHL